MAGLGISPPWEGASPCLGCGMSSGPSGSAQWEELLELGQLLPCSLLGALSQFWQEPCGDAGKSPGNIGNEASPSAPSQLPVLILKFWGGFPDFCQLFLRK